MQYMSSNCKQFSDALEETHYTCINVRECVRVHVIRIRVTKRDLQCIRS